MLKRPQLKYHPGGHPVLSKEDIDAYAMQFLKAYFASNVCNPSKLSATELLELVREQDGVTYTINDLGHESLRKLLGRIYPTKKHILLDTCLTQDRVISFPFVAAHEVAHWLLHRDCDITAIRAQESFPDDHDETEKIDTFEITWTSLQRIEWQANKLAAAFLIPKKAAIHAIYALQTEFGINTRKGIIYKNASPAGSIETYAQIEKVAATFGVSNTVTRIRLKDLGLYHEQSPNMQRPDRTARNPFSSVDDMPKL
ncbi:MAG TPA: ImmA/IrrE family metallo-endopeptidase [Opitutaceae bacterium]|jgi:Zn-dependent peptidase ImmA (M78 family)|nr:ImmA/IrrE family metallo-endopeptidase [Opitutaceae bacterium]